MHLSAYRMLQGDTRIWSVVTLYGLAAGVLTYAASVDYEDRQVDSLALVMNYLAIPVMVSMYSSGIPMPSYILSIVIIGVSVAVWSLIGLVVCLFVKLFRLDP